jgi:predicted DCC family thiol-disulfide oxidoreductase YuxK
LSATKVYYNSACPVCRAGIRDQRCRMEAQGIADVEWLDVHSNPELAKELGSDLESVRERLHVKGDDGAVRVGTDAFAVLFGRTRGQRWLAKVLTLPVVQPLAQLAYNGFARGLYTWNRAKRRW